MLKIQIISVLVDIPVGGDNLLLNVDTEVFSIIYMRTSDGYVLKRVITLDVRRLCPKTRYYTGRQTVMS